MCPAVCSVTLAEAPGAIEPVENVRSTDVESCVVVSLFVQVIRVPTATVTGFGEKADVVNVDAPLTIEMAIEPDELGGGVGVGVGEGAGLLSPEHAASMSAPINTMPTVAVVFRLV
jgi:hypothetical protein